MSSITWTDSSGGLWGDGSNWSSGTVPGPSDSATISLAPGTGLTSYTVLIDSAVTVGSVTLDQADAYLQVGEFGGNPSTLTTDFYLQAGELDLNYGTLSGTVIQTGGTFGVPQDDFGGFGTFDNVTWEGALEPLTYSYSYEQSVLDVQGSLTLTGSNGSGAGLLMLNQYLNMDFLGAQTLDNAVVDFSSPSEGGEFSAATLSTDSFGGTSGALTFGPHLRMNVTGLGTLGDNGLMTNNGTIDVSASGTFAIGAYQTSTADTFASAGSIIVDGLLTLSSTVFANSGSIDVAGGGTLQIFGQSGGTIQNSGVILDDGEVALAGTLTTAEVASLALQVGQAGSVVLDGTLENTGASLVLGSGGVLPALTLQADGDIVGGTVTAPGTSLVYDGGTLDGVTLSGPLALTAAGASVTIADGISFSVSNVITVTGGVDPATQAAATLNFVGSQALDDAVVNIGSVYGNVLSSIGGTLQFSSTTQVNLLAGSTTLGDSYQNGTIINDGVVSASRDATLSLAAGNSFVNDGTMSLTDSSVLYVAGSVGGSNAISVRDSVLELGSVDASILSGFTLTNSTVALAGTLTATGETLTVGAGGIAALHIGAAVPGGGQEGATVLGGTILAPKGNVVVAGQVALTGVTYQGNLDVRAPDTTLTIDGLTLLAPSGKHAGTLSVSGSNSALDVASATLDHMTVALNGTTLQSSVPNLTLGKHLVIETSNAGGTIQGNTLTSQSNIDTKYALAINAGLFVNDAAISMPNAALTLGGSYFDNAGSIIVSSAIFGAGELTNSGSIDVIYGAGLDYDNYYSLLPPNGTSFDNIGTLTLGGGLSQQNGGDPPVPLLNEDGALIVAVGSINVPIDNDGTVSVTGGSLSMSGNVTGAGTLDIGAAGTLSLTGKVTGQVVDFGGPGGVLGLDEKKFISSIGGFAAGDTIDLFHLKASAASFSGDSIVVTLTAGRTVDLKTTTALTGSLDVTSDGHGGSLIDFAGTLPAGTVIAGPVGAVSGGWAPSADATTMPHIWVGVEGHDVAQGVLL